MAAPALMPTTANVMFENVTYSVHVDVGFVWDSQREVNNKAEFVRVSVSVFSTKQSTRRNERRRPVFRRVSLFLRHQGH